MGVADLLYIDQPEGVRKQSTPIDSDRYYVDKTYGVDSTKNPFTKENDIKKEAIRKVKELLNPEQKITAEKVWDGIKIRSGLSDIDTRGNKQKTDSPIDVLKNINKARLENTADAILSANIGLQKLTGGLNALVGNEKGQQVAQRSATQSANLRVDPNSLSSMAGEVAPELIVPAVGSISRTANIGKRILQGAGSGAVLTGGYEKLKDMSGIKEGLESNVATATGLGGVIGGIVGGLTKNPELGKTIGEAFVAGDDKAKEAILETYPEAKDAVAEYFSKNTPVPSKTQPAFSKTKSIEQVKEAVNQLPTREIVRPESKVVRTKSGEKIDSKDVLSGKKAIEDIEYNVVEPKAEVGKELENQTYVPKVSNPKQFKYGYDSRGRIYTEDASLMSPQGGVTQKASLKQRTKPAVDDVHEEVSRRLEFFDNDAKLRSRYGQTQAGYKESKEIPRSQEIANRLQFEKDQYKQLLKDNSIPREMRSEARAKLSMLNKTKVKDYVASEKELANAEVKFQDQFKVESKSQDTRDRDIAEEYKAFKESEAKRNKEDYKKTSLKTEPEIKRQIVKNATDSIAQAKKAISEISKKERLAGRDFDVKKITQEQRKTYRDEIAKIEDVQNARSDLQALKDGKISVDELQYRERRRIDEDLARNSKSTFNSVEETKQYRDSIKQRYEDIGVYVKDEDIKINEPKERSGKTEPEDKKAEREASEIKQSEAKHNGLVSSLERFRRTGKIERVKSGERVGQKILSDSQIDDVRRGYLSSKEIADKTSPIGKAEDISDLKVQARESANLKTTQAEQKKLGLKWEVNPKEIQFKETLQDASNSVAQITAVLLGSKNLARLAKSAGKESIGDIRTIIADEMVKHLPKDFPIVPSKESVKPTFMTENYGQGQKGLVRNIMKTNKVDKATAEQFLNAYNKSFENIAPEMVQLRNHIMDTFKKGNGKIEYTLPDGFKVKFELKKELNGSYYIKGKDASIKIKTDSVDDMSSAILPNIIHSVDAYVARQMNKKGIATVHDAFQTPKGMSDEFVQAKYGEVMAKVNESNILDTIMKSMGDESKSLKKGDLSSDAIKESAMSKESLTPEEIKGEVTKAKEREIDVSTKKTPSEVMKEFMAKDNVREENANQLVKAMTNEAGYRTMSVAREGDDVFERQIALAHQSSAYNPKMEIKPPEGVNEAVWNRVQREIFNEARAKLEYNPLLNGIIKGKRRFFTESGKLIGNETKTFQELLVEEKRIGRKLLKSLSREEQKSLRNIAPNYERLQYKVKSWETGKVLSHDEALAKSIVQEARTPTIPRSQFKKNIDKVKAYFVDQVSDSKVTKDFQRLLAFRKHNETQVAKRAEELKKKLDSKLTKEERKDWVDAFLKTDYHAIREMTTKEMADKFEKAHDNMYQLAKPYIDQSAKALGEASEQIGFFRNNARAIVEELNLLREMEPIIDKLISIKAMTPEAWKEVERVKDTDHFRYVMEIIGDNKARSAKEFGSNPEDMVKGYVSEVYNGAKRIEGDKVKYDAESRLEAGAIPNTLERKKVGSWQEDFPQGDFKTLEEKNIFAEKNRLKVTKEGNFRRVADAELKDKAGRSTDFNEILTKTTQSIDAKEVQKLISKNIIDEMVKGTELFSQEAKEGYRKITELEASRMPKVVGDSLAGRYVLEAYDKRLFGRDEVRLYSGESQVGKIADRLLKNTILHFKQNVILKNPKSYLNATLVNQLIATTAGVNPKNLLKYQREALDEIKNTDNLISQIADLKARGKDYSSLQKELDKSLLYRMEQEGLAINKLEVAGDDSTLLGQMLSDLSFGKLDKITNEAYLSQSSKLGKPAFKVFGAIDTQGRYTLAKHFMDNGMDIKDAVQKANGLFGDMDQMAPAFIEAIDKYGIIPFAKWASLTIPQLMKLTKENPAKALGLAIAVYGFQAETNLDYSTVNPLEGAVNFLDSSVSQDYIKRTLDKGIKESSWEKVKTYYTPKVYSELQKELFEDKPHEMFFKHQQSNEDFKPLTQRIRGE